jgi:serine/threonine kinase 32
LFRINYPIVQLLDPDPKKRIGCLAGGIEDFKAHPWFKDFPWSKLEKRHLVPHFKPRTDVVNAEFTQSNMEFDMKEPDKKVRADTIALR